MGGKKPAKLCRSALDRFASIAGIQRRDHFDPQLTKLVAGASCDTAAVAASRRDRSEIVRTGRVFVKAIREATPAARQEVEVLFPYGTIASLEIALDAMSPTLRSARLRNRQFVVLLCVAVEKAGGRLTLNETNRKGTLVELLDALKPYLPDNFPPVSISTLRDAKESAGHLVRFLRD